MNQRYTLNEKQIAQIRHTQGLIELTEASLASLKAGRAGMLTLIAVEGDLSAPGQDGSAIDLDITTMTMTVMARK